MKLWQTDNSKTDNQLVEQFTAGDDISLDEKLYRYDLLGSLAHAYMLSKIGVLSTKEFSKLRAAVLKLLDAEIHLTVQDEDVHTKVENLLVHKLGELGQKIHTGRSRNDQVLLDTRLHTKDKLSEIALSAMRLAMNLNTLAQRHEFVPMPGYTHTRRAMPSSVGLWASAFAESLLEDLVLLQATYELNDRSPLGAAAGYGVPLNLDRELAAKLLGFKSVQKNTIGVMNSRGRLEFAILAALSTLMQTVARLATDLIWFSADEFQFFQLADRFCTCSSLMPNKKNPDMLELVRARAASIIANMNQLAMITHGLTSGYHRDLQETKGSLLRSLETTRATVQIMSALIVELEVNEEKLEAACSADLFAVDHVIEQVQKGVPFRQAYQNVKRNLSNIKALKPREALKKRNHIGGSGNLCLDQLEDAIESQTLLWQIERKQFQTTLEKLTKL
ncbi:argininosuccinate lyase [Candidatus Acetothermia bacterium]|nr:argininosuccinate lyase [Candidatus Acetothermia bacterium]